MSQPPRSFWEFFENDDGHRSMTRLLMFLSFWPSTLVVLWNINKTTIADILYIYIGGFVLGYIGGKGADAVSNFRNKGQQNARSTSRGFKK